MKCGIDNLSLKLILTSINSALLSYSRAKSKALKEGLPIDSLQSELKLKVLDCYKLIQTGYEVNSDNINSITETILERFDRYLLGEIDRTFFSLLQARDILLNPNLPNLNLLDFSTDNLTDTELVRIRKDASISFINNAFGRANEVKTRFIQDLNQHLFDVLFVNRGSISELNLGVVTSDAELNSNIRQYQELLFKKIIDYLKVINSEGANVKFTELKFNQKMPLYVLDDKGLKSSEYFNIVLRLAGEFLSFKNKTADELRLLYNRSLDITNSQTDKERARMTLEAYNANLILNHFDDYLSYLLGDALKIKDFNLLTGENKYSLSSQTANVIKTWRTSENINVELESDKITRLAIATTPIYNWLSNVPKYGLYLSFADYSHLIAKIKDLVYLPLASLIDFNEALDNSEILLNTLSLETLDFLRESGNLRVAINLIRRSPRKYIHLLFDLLTNERFRLNYPNIYLNFTKDELNKLWSLNKGIFGISLSNSIYNLVPASTVNNDFYANIVLSADSIFNVHFLQYYRNEDGVILSRTLLDLGINNLERKIKLSILLGNSIKLVKNPSYFDGFTYKNGVVSFTVPNTTILVSVSLSSGNVVKFDKSNKPDKFRWDALWQKKEFADFIDNTLKQNLQTNVALYSALSENSIGEFNLQLFETSCRITAMRYYSYSLIKGLGIVGKNKILKEAHNVNLGIRYNSSLAEIEVITEKDIPLISKISRELANLLGLSTASMVKDGEGNTLSALTFSRLLGSLQSLWEILERLPDSATNEFTLLKPGVLKAIYTCKEFHDYSGENKETTSSSVLEMAYSEILIDYIGGLLTDNTIALLPSVNSDKSTIGRIIIDALATIDGKTIKDMTVDDLHSAIMKELGTFYTKMKAKVNLDFDTISAFMGIDVHPDTFDAFNNMDFGGMSPVLYLKSKVREYNQLHRNNPIELIDLVHYISKKIDEKECLVFNPVIDNLIKRFKNIENTREFFSFLNLSMIIDLLKANFVLNVDNDNLKECVHIKRTYPDWINDSGNLVLAKLNGTDIVQIPDIIKLGFTDPKQLYGLNLLINPILEKYNLLDYFFTLEFMNTSVGSFVAHPAKKNTTDLLELEAACFLALHKRNVSMTAAMLEFLLGLLSGIPSDYNIAVVDDIVDFLGTLNGIINKIKPFDGATFVNPFIVILENNSLRGAKAGITKKLFVHFKNEKTGTGGIIKTAGFGITNDWLRNSPLLLNMMRKMTNRNWLNLDGSEYFADITKDYNGRNIDYGNIYYESKGLFYKITNIEHLGENTYNVTRTKVTEQGRVVGKEETTLATINNNYDLWRLFGGAYSLSFNDSGKLQYSNRSVELVVIAMNSIGLKLSNNIRTLDDLYQPLKHSDIHYVATAGAVKQGAANINPSSSYADDTPFDFQIVHMLLAGIQLDKEHHADDAELSLMTQVISACAAKGFTFEKASKLYSALSLASLIATKDFLKAMRLIVDENHSEALQETVIKVIVDNLANSKTNNGNFAQVIAEDLIARAKEGKDISFRDAVFPLSDNTIYAKVLSIVASYLTNAGIKLKIPGLLSVLTPSFNIMKLYNGHKREYYKDFDREIAEAQNNVTPVFVQGTDLSISNLELGRYYIIDYVDGTSEIKLIATPKDYKKLKDNLATVSRVTESLKEGRDLAAYNIHFNSDLGLYQLWDLDSVLYSFALMDAKTLEDLQEISNAMNLGYIFDDELLIPYYKELLKIDLDRIKLLDLLNLSLSSESVLSKYNKLIRSKEDTQKWYKRYINWVNITLGNKHGDTLILDGIATPVNSDNFDIVDAKIRSMFNRSDSVRIDGNYVTVDKSSIKISPYEIIMPKTFKTAYGLDEFASLDEIKDNPDYFIEQYIKNLATKINSKLFDIELKCTNGNHYYLALKKYSSLKLLSNINTVELDGKLYRLDNANNIMYEITPDTKIYVDRTGVEVIVDPNLEFFLDNLAYDVPKISSNLLGDKLLNILSVLENSNAPQVEKYYKYIKSAARTGKLILENSDEYHAIDVNDENNPIVKIGRAKYLSFLKSLDIVATRTPSLSMQSFMPMRVVAFDNPDINTAYVSTLQILLLGSDYDIDAVSLATYDIDRNGLLQLWSPYADIASTQLLLESLKLPIPTGKSVKEDGKLPVSDNLGAILNALAYFKDLLTISPKYLKKGEEWIESEDLLTVELSPNANLSKLANFLRYYSKNFAIPIEDDMPRFSRWASTNLWQIGTTENELGLKIPVYKSMNKGQIDSFFKLLAGIIDKHNLYFDKISKSKLSRIVNNIEMNNIYEIIEDPANLIQATTSVDGTTGPLKSIADESPKAKDAKYRTPGNFVNKLYSIIENLVGKLAIGICAVGLKTFFGLTLYANYILNYGTEEDLKRLILGRSGITIGDKLYKTLANIRALNPITIKDDELLSALALVGNDYDSALILSALLSLATDNAKELSLSKLNATTKMIGMYTYGLTIGMHFSEITKVLMSPVGDTICDILDGNVFTRDREYRRVNDLVFDYFDKGPTKVYKILGDLVYMVLELLSKILTLNAILHKEHSSLPTLVKTLASLENFTLLKKLEIVQLLRKTKDTDSNFFVDFFEKYICQYDKILLDKDNYDNIKTLAKGALEMFIIGLIYSLNLGIKTDQASFINLVSNIEDVFINAGFENKVNIVKFAYDERYRLSMIRAYEDAKGTFNILDAISSNPHTLAYIKAAATALLSFKNSFKFRTVYLNILEAMETVGTLDRTSIVKGLLNYVGDYLRDNWFISRNINFVIPKGNVDQNGETLKVDTTAELGYKLDNVIFKLWVENEVIPNLKKGKIGDNFIIPIKENMFIQLLTNDLLTNNVDHNPSIVYTLPINMLPRTDELRNIFNLYKAEFNKLAQYSYEYKTDSGVHSIPLVDLFTYYAMIANNWKLSEVSLVSILEDFLNNGIIADFHKFEDTLDKSTETLSFLEDMIPYIAPIDSSLSSKKTYIYGNSEEGRVLMRSYVNEDHSRIYSPIDIEQSTEKEIIFNVNDKSIRLNYDLRTKDIRYLGIGLNHLPKTIEALKGKVPITKKDGRIYVDIKTLLDLINNELNKC